MLQKKRVNRSHTQRKNFHRKIQSFLLAIIIIGILFDIVYLLYGKFFSKSVPSQTAAYELSSAEYAKIRDNLITIEDNKSPREALDELAKLISADDKVARSCHGLAHELGNHAFIKYNDVTTALSYQDDVCGSGYIHGVIEAKLTGSKDILTEMMTICPATNAGKCYHGVGHGLMYYTDNDLPKSLTMCDRYEDLSARVSCGEGVFMENFSTDRKLHHSKYLSVDNTFYPCNEQEAFYKSICYFYAPSFFLELHKNDYPRALAWCNTAEPAYRLTCINGVGSRAIKQNIHNPQYVEELCSHGKTDETTACLDGMVSYYLVHYSSAEKTQLMCQTLSPEHQEICLASIVKRRDMFFE